MIQEQTSLLQGYCQAIKFDFEAVIWTVKSKIFLIKLFITLQATLNMFA